MAVAREEFDSDIAAHCGRGARSESAAAAPLAHPPAPKLWPRGCAAGRPSANDPASLLITDFSREPAWTVQAQRPMDAALLEMTCAGTDALLVERSGSVIGLVTYQDIQGPRPLELRACGFAGPELSVADVMIPWDRLPLLDWRSIAASRVHHLEEWARNTRAAHALLMEARAGVEYVRGLISRAQIERLLGCSL